MRRTTEAVPTAPTTTAAPRMAALKGAVETVQTLMGAVEPLKGAVEACVGASTGLAQLQPSAPDVPTSTAQPLNLPAQRAAVAGKKLNELFRIPQLLP
jgi:hypothetical protein